ncbi:MAG: bifunctional [glutamine synthetase] adenylyltransferase/[glutamine synthetase]-adenylyl-L-tyrosine phosphorylase [Acidimicrobiales bacterium]
MATVGTELDDAAAHSADPPAVRASLARIGDERPDAAARLAADPCLAAAAVAVLAAGRWLAPVVERDPLALDVLADLDAATPVTAGGGAAALLRWYRLDLLRIAARDLVGLDPLEVTGIGLAASAAALLDGALRLAGADGAAVIGMGKLGAAELNYASDVDVLLVADEPAAAEPALRRAVATARRAVRVDLALRPGGRDGDLVRTLAGYQAHWDGWAEPWERQALVKARPVAGDGDLGARLAAAAAVRVWGRPFTPEELRSVRSLKARAERELAGRRLTDRELKRGRGGIRDVEFAVQLLQLVHGPADTGVRAAATLPALVELAAGGYVDPADAADLGAAYRRLRAVEHRLQLVDGAANHVLPRHDTDLDRLARTLGIETASSASAGEVLAEELRRHRATVRAIHERLWFRPLLEAFGEGVGGRGAVDGGTGLLSAAAAADRLAAFGFADVERTRRAVEELTRGLTRSSRLMQALLPLVLGWLSEAPDPDLGLLALRDLASRPQRGRTLVEAFRDSPDVAQRLCLVLGTSRLLGEHLGRNPDLATGLVDAATLRPRDRDELAVAATSAVAWRDEPEARRTALKRFTDREGLRIGVADVLGHADRRAVGRGLAALAETAVAVAIEIVEPPVPLAVVALGRFGGGELSYASDLDIIFVTEAATAADIEAAERATARVLRLLAAGAPHLYDVDATLRPEGSQGSLVRSIDGWRAYLERWAEPWERLALVRARPVAGDDVLGRAFTAVVDPWVWGRPVDQDDRRAIRRAKVRAEQRYPRAGRPAGGDDPDFSLKHGRGALADVEFCTQLLQLEHGVRAGPTVDALAALAAAGVLDTGEHHVLTEAHAFCDAVRDRAFLVTGVVGDALPARAEHLHRLAVSLDTSPQALRGDFRRLTRRARAVVERRFYGVT